MRLKYIEITNKGDENFPKFECTKASMSKYDIDLDESRTLILYVDTERTLVYLHTLMKVMCEFGYSYVGKYGQKYETYIFKDDTEQQIFDSVKNLRDDFTEIFNDKIQVLESRIGAIDSKIDSIYSMLTLINSKLEAKDNDKIELD